VKGPIVKFLVATASTSAPLKSTRNKRYNDPTGGEAIRIPVAHISGLRGADIPQEIAWRNKAGLRRVTFIDKTIEIHVAPSVTEPVDISAPKAKMAPKKSS
jgi:hypothetical protein